MQGWIKLYRELLEKPIWLLSTAGQRSVLVAILMLANHSAKKWEWQGMPFEVQPGQFITSLPSLARKSGKGTTVQMVRGSLVRFSKLGFLTDQSTGSGRLITVVNWAIYQGEESKTTDHSTDGQQTNNRPTTPNKNDKNEKNEKKKDTSPTSEKPKYGPEDEPFKIANHLLKAIRENNPNFSMKNDERKLQSWSNDIRLAHERDGRDYKKLNNMVTWCQNDSFWRTNILSGAKLRKQYDQMAAQANEESRKNGARIGTPEQQVLTTEEGSARSADYMAQLAAKYEKEGNSGE